MRLDHFPSRVWACVDAVLRVGEPSGACVEPWLEWSVERTLLVLVAVMYIGIWVQVSLMHWAGGFAFRAMWAPVFATPIVAAGALVASLDRGDPWGWVAVGLLTVAVASGLYGLYRHVRGIASQIGGLSKRNLLSGPPPILPLAYSLIGVVGLVALLAGA
jgi:hypothetical protein